MTAESFPPPRGRPDGGRERVVYLLAHLFGGNQRAMARALGVSQALISQVVNGNRAAGPRLMAALARHPGVDPEWLRGGTGQPLVLPERGTLPVAAGLLPGPPLLFPQLLSGSRHPVADALGRPTRYWVALAPDSDLVREPRLRLAPGDLLLLEADPAWTRRPDLTDGRLCGVRLAARPEPVYRLGRVAPADAGAVVSLFGGAFVPPYRPTPSRVIRTPEAIEARKLARERAVAEARRAAAEGLPIDRADIVAVQVYMARPELF